MFRCVRVCVMERVCRKKEKHREREKEERGERREERGEGRERGEREDCACVYARARVRMRVGPSSSRWTVVPMTYRDKIGRNDHWRRKDSPDGILSAVFFEGHAVVASTTSSCSALPEITHL